MLEDGSIFKELYNLLEEYENPKIILTSANDEQIEKFGLNEMPYKVFTLKHDPEKTDPEYYERMLDHFDLTTDNVIYFEHSQEAVKSAESMGIVTHYYESEKQDLIKLREFLDHNLYV